MPLYRGGAVSLFSKPKPNPAVAAQVIDNQIAKQIEAVREDMRNELRVVGLWCKAIEKRVIAIEQKLTVMELESKLGHMSDRNKHFKGNRVQL
jgi:hypothetical protein